MNLEIFKYLEEKSVIYIMKTVISAVQIVNVATNVNCINSPTQCVCACKCESMCECLHVTQRALCVLL